MLSASPSIWRRAHTSIFGSLLHAKQSSTHWKIFWGCEQGFIIFDTSAMTAVEQARRYIARIDPAISGQNGHDVTFHVACVLVQDFALSIDDARSLMAEYSARCVPPWTEREINHKLADAEKQPPPAEGRGYRLSKHHKHMFKDRAVSAPAPPLKKTEPATKRYEMIECPVPPPIADGTRELLRAAFAEGETIRIAQARTNEEGKEVPKDAGITLTREQWLAKLKTANGDINRILKSHDRNGIFISVNPMKPGGSKDSDVTSYRHALVEWDNIPLAEQWSVIVQSNLPVTAVIASGGKSIHAWVRVDAADKREFDERVAFLYRHFELSGRRLDDKNKNPSRFSRLAGCERGNSRQELLSLQRGAPCWADWVADISKSDLGQCLTISELMECNTDEDPNCILGFRNGKTLRYLCRSKAAWLIAPSGVGKSSLMAEFAIGWALGEPVFGITPARPLKTLVIQAENDKFDLAEMVQGVMRGRGIDRGWDPEGILDRINQNVKFYTESVAIGPAFADKMHRLIDREKADIVNVDPLLSYAGIDVTKNEQAGPFVRKLIEPVLLATGVVMIGTHHTGKPKPSKETQNWTALDWAYSGLGASELVNWARAVLALRLIDSENRLFALELCKRGSRAGATHPDGDFTQTLYLRHSRSGGIRWEQIQPPEKADEQAGGKIGRPSNIDTIASMNLHSVLSKIPTEGESGNALGKRLVLFSKEKGCTIGATTARTKLLDRLIENGKLIFNSETDTYQRGPNA